MRMKANIRRRHIAGKMNKAEAEYAAMLETQRITGEIWGYFFERFTLKLADDTRYTPDFVVVLRDGELRIDEVKGFMEEDAWVKFKVASELFPFSFRLAKKRAKRDGGGWVFNDFSR